MGLYFEAVQFVKQGMGSILRVKLLRFWKLDMCNPFLAPAFGLVQDLKVSSVKLGVFTMVPNSSHNV